MYIFSKLVMQTCNTGPPCCTIEDYLDHRPYLGYVFVSKINDLKSKRLLFQTKEDEMRQHCQHFLPFIHKQLRHRRLNNFTVMRNVYLFSINNVLQPVDDLPTYCKVVEYLGVPRSILVKA